MPRIGQREATRRTAATEHVWAAVVENEGEAVGTRSQSALSSELKLERGLEPGIDNLFPFEPDGAH